MAFIKCRKYECNEKFLQERSTDFLIISKRRRRIRKKTDILMHKFKK